MKRILAFAAAMLLATPAAFAAGYDLSNKNISDVTVADPSAMTSTDYIPVYRTGTGYKDSEFVSANGITGLGNGMVAVGAGATSATCAANGTGRTNLINAATKATITLPAATGSGCTYRFEWASLPAQAGQTGDVIQVTGTDEFRGAVGTTADDSTGAFKGWSFAGGADTDQLTFTSTTKYVAAKGVGITFKDVASGVWDVSGTGASTGTEASIGATGQRS